MVNPNRISHPRGTVHYPCGLPHRKSRRRIHNGMQNNPPSSIRLVCACMSLCAVLRRRVRLNAQAARVNVNYSGGQISFWRERESERENEGGLIVLYTDNRHSIFSISLRNPSNSEQERETDEKRESRAQKGLQMLVIHLSRVAWGGGAGPAGGLGGWEGGKMLDRKSTLSDMISSAGPGARDISRTGNRALGAQTHPHHPSDHLKKPSSNFSVTKITCRFCLSLSGFVCVMNGNLLRGLRDVGLFDACRLARCGSYISERASMNFRQVFKREKPYVFISRLSQGCHWSLGRVAPLVSQPPAIQTRKSHLFWRTICVTRFPSSLVNNHDGLTFISF